MVGITDSQFYMWRTLFALAHADDVVTDEEISFMAKVMEDLPFSGEQSEMLKADAQEAQDIEKMFLGITDVQDQAAFFKFAHELVHIDGDYGAEEQAIMLRLKELHVRVANIDDLVGSVSLELETDFETQDRVDGRPPFEKIIHSFRDQFLKKFSS